MASLTRPAIDHAEHMQNHAEESAGAPLRVAFCVRRDLNERPGGDTIQVQRTAEALKRLGVTIVFCTPGEFAGAHAREPFDLAHLWHLERLHETMPHFEQARRAGVPIALSPIYWPANGRPRIVRAGAMSRLRWWREDAKNVIRWLRAGDRAERRAIGRALWPGWASCRAALLLGADVLLPNSSAEGELLAQEAAAIAGNARIGGGPLKWRVVCNAIDPAACHDAIAASHASDREVDRRGLICVGHFDPRKNQLHLIRELRDVANLTTTFVGQARRMHARYYATCVEAAGATPGRFVFGGSLPPDQVLARLTRARVHVCPSLLETPGLANLEAAVCGCAIVAPECPPVREYFHDDIEYFDPATPGSLRAAVERAIERGPRPALAERVEREFNWTRAAEQTLGAYREVLARAKSSR